MYVPTKTKRSYVTTDNYKRNVTILHNKKLFKSRISNSHKYAMRSIVLPHCICKRESTANENYSFYLYLYRTHENTKNKRHAEHEIEDRRLRDRA